jgi:hypothetical protein
MVARVLCCLFVDLIWRQLTLYSCGKGDLIQSLLSNQAARFIFRQLRQEHLKSGSSGISTWPHCSQMNHSGRRNIGPL